VRQGQLRIVSGVWEVGLTYIPIKDIAVYWCGFSSQTAVDIMRPAFNFKPKYRVKMLTREQWTKGTGFPPAVKGLTWFTGGSKTNGGAGAGVYGHSAKRRLRFSLGRYATVFQAEIYAILACVHKIKYHNRSETCEYLL
jgi:hypothetical protein